MKQLQSPMFSLLKRIDVELTPLDSTQEQIIPGKNLRASVYLLYNAFGLTGSEITVIDRPQLDLCKDSIGNKI